MDYEKLTADIAEKVEKALDKYLPEKDNYQKTIYKAMRYSLLGGGKRIRAILTVLCCRMAGGTEEDAMPFACAIEMIHAYSLIHDDLPCMDNDDMRRGKPTCHKAFGEAMAVLAGDGLLGYAFETALLNGKDTEKTLRALKTLAVCLGPEGMLGGQVVDLESENTDISYEKLVYLQNHKTGALIKAACLMGNIAGGGHYENILESYAGNIGLAFQIRDDVLDVESTEDVLGKPIGSDEKSHKSTFVTHFGTEKAKETVTELSEKAAASVENINEYGAALAYLARKLAKRSK